MNNCVVFLLQDCTALKESLMKAVGYCFLCFELKYVQTRLHTVTFENPNVFLQSKSCALKLEIRKSSLQIIRAL